MKQPEPFCDCTGCIQRTKERLDNASGSDLRHAIAALKAYLADFDEQHKPATTEEK